MVINMKRFMLMLFSVIITFGTLIPYASAEEEQDYIAYMENVDLLTALGIISSDIDTSDMNRQATRAELIDMVTGLRNVRGMSVSSSRFSDVTVDTKYGRSIMIAEALGIIQGADNGLFYPENYVSAADAYKVVLDALGYAPIIGTYPEGYISKAASTGLARNVRVDKNGSLNMEGLAELFVNAMSTEVMKYYINKGYAADGTTAMEEFCEIYTSKGKITSIYDESDKGAYITKTDKIYIDGDRFKLNGNTDAEKYLGYEVEYYYKDFDGENAILYMTPTSKNSSITIDYDSISGYTKGELRYDDGKERTARIETDFAVLNGESELIGNDSFDFSDHDGGYVRIVDSDGNGRYDFVYIIKYKNYYVDTINADKHLIYTKNAEKLSLDINDYSSETSILICEKYRNVISFGEIKKGDVISAAQSVSGLFITFYRSSRKVTGTVSEISYEDDKINARIGEHTYSSGSSAVSLNTGEQYTLYLDFMDRIAYSDSAGYTSGGFAYLINAWMSDEGYINFRMYTDEGELLEAKAVNKVRVGKENSGRAFLSSSDADYGNMVNVLKATADNPVNGVSQLIKYKKNSGGEITSVVTAVPDKSESEFSLDYAPDSGYVRGGMYVDGTYRISYGDTAVFCVPSVLNEYDKYSVIREMDSSVYYPGLKLFDIDENTNVPRAAVFFTDVQNYKSTAVTYAALGVVESADECWGDGEIVTRLKFMINGASKTTEYKEGEVIKNINGGKVAAPKDLHTGDVLQAYIGADGKIAACRLVYERTDEESGIYKLPAPSSIVDDNIVLYGRIKYSDGEYMVLSEASGLEAVASLSGARVYVYDSEIRGKDKVRLGDASDLAVEQEAVVKKSATAYNQIVIYK